MTCSDLPNCFCWSSMGLIFMMLCSSCCFYNFEVSVYVIFVSYVGVLAPVLPVQGVLRLVLLVANAFFGDFYAFGWGFKLLPKF